jgi:hypothetical protein
LLVVVGFCLPRVLGVAVYFVLALAGGAAGAVAPADDAAVAFAYACAEAAEDFGVLVAPFPDSGGWLVGVK